LYAFLVPKNFQDGTVGGTNYKKLAANLDNEDAAMFVQWLEQGVFDALSRKYLSTVLLEIYEEVPAAAPSKSARNEIPAETQKGDSSAPYPPQSGKDTTRRIIEVFSFSVDYPAESAGPEFTMAGGDNVSGKKMQTSFSPDCSRGAIKQATSEVLRRLVQQASALAPLPENRVVTMKLLYTSDTPADYEPPMFRPAGDESTNCWFENRPLRLSPGKVHTPYHEMHIRIRTAADTIGQNCDDDIIADDSHQTAADARLTKRDEIEEHSESNVDEQMAENESNDDTEGESDSSEDEIEASDVVDGVPNPDARLIAPVGTDRDKREWNRFSQNSKSEPKNMSRSNNVDETARNVKLMSLHHQEPFQGSQIRSASQENPSRRQDQFGGTRVPDASAKSRPATAPRRSPAGVPGGQEQAMNIDQVEAVGKPGPFGLTRPPLPLKRRESVDRADSQATTKLFRPLRRKVSEIESQIHQKPKRTRRAMSQHRSRRGEPSGCLAGQESLENVSSCI
jgi:HORMA domain